MGDASRGPVSSMPGAKHRVPTGAMCDEHPERLAVARIQGETDSFGCEMLDMCQECLDNFNYHRLKPRPGTCDWCRHEKPNLTPRRDWEEGMAGPVYSVCDDCIKRDNDNIDKELAASREDEGLIVDIDDDSFDYPDPSDDPIGDDHDDMPEN